MGNASSEWVAACTPRPMTTTDIINIYVCMLCVGMNTDAVLKIKYIYDLITRVTVQG